MLQDVVPQLEDIATIKVAIEISLYPELKSEILCSPDSDYDKIKNDDKFYCRQQWQKIIKEKASAIMTKLFIPKPLQQKLMGILLQIGMRMLSWALYHEGFLGYSREVSFKVLNRAFFTPEGIMDNKKAAEKLIMEDGLTNKQRYDLACLYCLTDPIYYFAKRMTRRENIDFYSVHRLIREPNIVLFWNNCLRHEMDKLTSCDDVYRLQTATECGSKAAVEYCFEKAHFRSENDIVESALLAVKKVDMMKEKYDIWDILPMPRNSDIDWVPSNFYVDVLCFLISKMTEVTWKEFLNMEVHSIQVMKRGIYCNALSCVLEYFLNWPYHDYFMKTVSLTWDILPESSYGFLLLKICHKIHPTKREYQESCLIPKTLPRLSQHDYDEIEGDNEIYDYRGLLEQFWIQSPERLKKYVFEKEIIILGQYFNCVAELLLYFLTVKHFTDNDDKVIRLILNNATDEEKQHAFRIISLRLIQSGEWEILNSFLNNWLSADLIDTFKRELCVTKAAQHICIVFTENGKWDEAENFMKWSLLNEKEIARLKKEMIYSFYGTLTYKEMRDERSIRDEYLIPSDVDVDSFLQWYFPSEEEINEFKIFCSNSESF